MPNVSTHLKAKFLLMDLAKTAEWNGAMHTGRREYLQRHGDISNYLTRPGAFIERLPQEQRDLLKSLRSEDLGNVLPPYTETFEVGGVRFEDPRVFSFKSPSESRPPRE